MILGELKSKWKILLFAAASILGIIIIKFIWNDTNEFVSYGSEIGEVLFNLSIGYLAAFIFYIIDIWVPEYKERKIAKQRIAIPLSRLLVRMKNPIDETIKKYGNSKMDFENIGKEDFIKMVNKINLSQDQGFILDFNGGYFSFGQCLMRKITEAEDYINQAISLPFKLDIELIVLLDEIHDSSYHNVMQMVNKINGMGVSTLTLPDGEKIVKITTGELINDIYFEYYQLFFKLKDYMKNNEIPITVAL